MNGSSRSRAALHGFLAISLFSLISLAAAFPVLAQDCVDYRIHMRTLGPVAGIESATCMVSQDTWAVFADGTGSLHTIDLSPPMPLQRDGVLPLGGEVQDLKAGPYPYVLATVSGVGLVVVSVGPTGELVQEGVLPLTASVGQLGVDGYRAAIHLQYMVVAYVDWSDPAAPVELGRTLLSDFWPSAVAVRGTDVFVGGLDPDYLPALWRVDFSAPENPVVATQSVVMPDPLDGESLIMDIIPTAERIFLSYQRVIRYGPMELDLRMVLITTPPDGEFTVGDCPVVDIGPGDVANLQIEGDEVFQFGSKLAVYDVQDPAAPTCQGRVRLENQVRSGVVVGDLALAGSQYYGVWQVWMGDHEVVPFTEVYQDSRSISGLAQLGDTVFGVSAAVDYPYSAWLELFALDASDPSAPVALGRYVDERTWPPVYDSLQIHDGMLYATGEGGLGVFDVSDPSSPQLAAEYTFAGNGPGLFLGDYLYEIRGLYRLDVFNAADPLQITPLAQGVLENVLAVTGRDDIMFVSRIGGDPRLDVYQVSEPAAPTLIGSVAAGASHRSLWIQGDFLFCQPFTGPVEVFDISDPAAPVSRSTIPIISRVSSLRLEGDSLYLSISGEGMQVVDLTWPTSPARLGGTMADGYWVSMVWVDGHPLYSDYSSLRSAPVHCPSAIPAGEGPAIPAASLVHAHPNPFNPRVNLRIDLPSSGLTRIGIVDVRGRRVRELISKYQSAGLLELPWNGLDDRGRALPSGTYFVRVEGNGFDSAGKITLLR